MERRNHARVAVNLKAALLNAQAMPMGCRIRDVSRSGMLLQHERHDKAATFRLGDTVEVRLSLKQGDERKVIPLPMTVRRVEENGIAAEFLRPQAQLMSLIEPYRLDKEETRKMVANQDEEKVAAGSSSASPSSAAAGTSTRASRRRFAVQRARVQLAETMKTAGEPAFEKKQPFLEPTAGEKPVTGTGNRMLYYVGLLSLVAAVGILLLDFSDRTQTENRISALESAVERQVNALTLLRARLSTSSDTPAEELAALNARVETLATSFAALETRVTQDAERNAVLSTTAAASSPGALAGVPQAENGNPATDTLKKSTPLAKPEVISHDGPWVINLLSLYDEAAANEFAEKARTRNVRADTNQVTVKGKQVWRVQVGGFPTRDEASAYADTSKEKLGLNSVWIFKKGQ